MTAEYEKFLIESDDFTRRFAMRGQNLMWFLGAGASASAGVPTAFNMVWDFKRQLFITQTKAAPQAVSDLSNPTVRSRIQDHVNASGRFPLPGSPNEYATLFEEVYPVEADRRRYLDEKLLGAKPSFGHLALVLSQPRNSSWRNGTLDTGKLMMGKRQFKVPSISGMTEY